MLCGNFNFEFIYFYSWFLFVFIDVIKFNFELVNIMLLEFVIVINRVLKLIGYLWIKCL